MWLHCAKRANQQIGSPTKGEGICRSFQCTTSRKELLRCNTQNHSCILLTFLYRQIFRVCSWISTALKHNCIISDDFGHIILSTAVTSSKTITTAKLPIHEQHQKSTPRGKVRHFQGIFHLQTDRQSGIDYKLLSIS